MRGAFGSRILDVATRILIPFIFLYGAYVILHGHYSAGGGFQGGTILAVGLILLRLVKGHNRHHVGTFKIPLMVSAIGLVVYLSQGFLPMLSGFSFLDYAGLPFPLQGASLRVLGSLLVEIGVGFTVCGTFVLIYELLVLGSERHV